MKTIDIVIPTLNRLEKLKRTMKSIPAMQKLFVRVIFDGEYRAAKNQMKALNAWHLSNGAGIAMGTSTLMARHAGSVACRNSVTPLCMDGVLPATDDVVFRPGAFEKMLAQFNERFPDDDGVLGVRQDREGHHPTGVCLVGQKFLQRYPGKLLYYPRYFHFAAQEIWWHAETIKRFAITEEIMLDHFHPGFMKAEMDETHGITASHRTMDHMIRNSRKVAGSIWGLDE